MPKVKKLHRTSKNALEHSLSINHTCRRRNGLSHKENLPLTFSNPKQSFSALNMRQGQTFSYGDFEQKGNSNGTQGFYRIDCYIWLL